MTVSTSKQYCRDTPHPISTSLMLLICLLAVTSSHAAGTIPRLSTDSDTATAGYYRLSWETDAEQVELQEANQVSFTTARTYYKGPDRAVVVSGKPDGTWYYRIRAITDGRPAQWSEPIAVMVAHHSLSRALMFLSLGVIVFVATVLMIVRGKRTVE